MCPADRDKPARRSRSILGSAAHPRNARTCRTRASTASSAPVQQETHWARWTLPTERDDGVHVPGAKRKGVSARRRSRLPRVTNHGGPRMDAKRFDTIAKALISETNRRRTLGGLLGGALAALGLSGADETDAAKSGKCKKECGLCESCKRGKCRKTARGKKVCKKGKCKPKENGEQCAGAGGTCQSGTCVCSDGAANCGASCCVNNQVCENGTCVCPAGLELCNGECVEPCLAGISVRNPETCGCCRINGLQPFVCTAQFPCCSGQCIA